VKPDEVALNIPFTFKRTGEEYNLEDAPTGVKIYRCDDFGPATKFIPTSFREDGNTIIIYIDDDVNYDTDFIENLLKTTGKVISHGISSEYYDMDYILEGVYGVYVDNSIIDKKLLQYYVDEYISKPECSGSDDYVLSHYFKQLNPPRSSHGYRHDIKTLPDALSNIQEHGKDRYKKCKKSKFKYFK
jgi:hypothetical protein